MVCFRYIIVNILHNVLERQDLTDLLYVAIQRPVTFITFNIESS